MSNLTAQNLKIFERNAPGPADYFPYDKPQDDKLSNRKPSMGTPMKNPVKQDPTPGPGHYWPFENDIDKPHHGTPGKMMKPTGLNEKIIKYKVL